MHELLTTWRNFSTNIGPYILPGDEALLQEGHYCNITSWSRYVRDREFGAPGDKRFHLGLLPQPFQGDIESASVYILMSNPGLGPADYYGEYEVPEYKDAMINNLKQTAANRRNPFLFLDPRFSWHGGYKYWHSKFTKLIAEFGNSVGVSYGESREFFQKKIAILELVPYHSINFHLKGKTFNELHSVKLIRSYVIDVLVPKAQKRQCLIIIARGERMWHLRKTPKQIIRYSKSEAQSAYLTPNSSGGKAILKFLKRIWR